MEEQLRSWTISRSGSQGLQHIATERAFASIIDEALDWEKRRGATFEADKTSIIHFTWNEVKVDRMPVQIKGQMVQPRNQVKILGVIMDSRLKYQEHIARAGAMELSRLRGLSSATARQLFNATVAPAVDYARNVWRQACQKKLAAAVNRVQKVAAQAILGTFLSVATSVAEAEAHIVSAEERHWRRVIKLCIEIHSLPDANRLRRTASRIQSFYPGHRSPFHQVCSRLKDMPLEILETVKPFLLAPWGVRVQVVSNKLPDCEAPASPNVCVAVSSSARNEVVGVGEVWQVPATGYTGSRNKLFLFTLGLRTEQSPYSGELAAIAYALRQLPPVTYCMVSVMSSNKSATLTLIEPGPKSGQEYVGCVYDAMEDPQR